EEKRDFIRKKVKNLYDNFLPEVKELAFPLFDQFAEAVNTLGVVPTMHMGMTRNGNLEFYDGKIRLIDGSSSIIEEFQGIEYRDVISERVKDYSYLKFPYYKKKTFEEGCYRVGPLARINVVDKIDTSVAQELLIEFRNKFGRPVNNSLLYHYARIIEFAYALEVINDLINDSDITGTKLRTPIKPRAGEAIGILEAHRGTLFHHYVTDEKGIVTDVNLIVATVGNNEAINRSVKATAKNLIVDGQPSEGMLNRLEMIVRAYDPCFSCATHALNSGAIATEVQLVDHTGNVTQILKNWSNQEK
ncbi:MAG: Ni/Fe hydrogenase subunit alpha, partial [Promethearchaeota archaeon]